MYFCLNELLNSVQEVVRTCYLGKSAGFKNTGLYWSNVDYSLVARLTARWRKPSARCSVYWKCSEMCERTETDCSRKAIEESGVRGSMQKTNNNSNLLCLLQTNLCCCCPLLSRTILRSKDCGQLRVSGQCVRSECEVHLMGK